MAMLKTVPRTDEDLREMFQKFWGSLAKDGGFLTIIVSGRLLKGFDMAQKEDGEGFY